MPAAPADDRLAAVRTLVHVVDCGSLTEAGRRTGLTPSAVSRQISRLEEALGVRLLERSTRSVRPTDAGLELCQRTRPLFDAFADATAAVRDSARELRGRLRLSASPALARTRLVPVLARLAAAHPALRFDVVLTAKRLDFFEDELDLAIREGPLDDSTLVARRLGTTEIFLCASPAYVAARGNVKSFADLADHDLLMVPAAEALRNLVAGRGGRRSELVARIVVNDLFCVRDLAEAGAGIGVLPDYVAAPALASGSLVRVLPDESLAELPIHAVWPSRRHLPRRVSVLLDALRDVFAAP